MATVKVAYDIVTCPNCDTELLRIAQNGVNIGKPFLECKKCGIIISTPYQQEWYNYKGKAILFLLPLIGFGAGLLVAPMMGEDLAIGLIAGVLCAIICAGVSISRIPAILRSKKRMRSIAYLNQLKEWNLIAPADYDRFAEKANLP